MSCRPLRGRSPQLVHRGPRLIFSSSTMSLKQCIQTLKFSSLRAFKSLVAIDQWFASQLKAIHKLAKLSWQKRCQTSSIVSLLQCSEEALQIMFKTNLTARICTPRNKLRASTTLWIFIKPTVLYRLLIYQMFAC